MKVIKHNIYVTPMVKAVAFRVERGFELSSLDTDETQSFQDLSQNEDPNADVDRTYF